MSNDSDLISIKELASKLKVADALLKKVIKDFNISTERIDKRVCLSAQSTQTIREILALRASGKKNQEIKELFDASVASAAAEAKPKAEPKAKAEDKPETTTAKETPSRPKRKKKPKSKAEDKSTTETEENKVEAVAAIEKEAKAALVDISGFLNDAEDEQAANSLFDEEGEEENSSDNDIEEELDLDDDEDIQETETYDKKLSPRKIRRRSFSFRYIQRQITNDIKRLNYIKNKLKRGRLSTQETMLLTDSLEHRSKLLSGWVHMLRWVKS